MFSDQSDDLLLLTLDGSGRFLVILVFRPRHVSRRWALIDNINNGHVCHVQEAVYFFDRCDRGVYRIHSPTQ